jgi:hypothetical protein
MPIRRYIFKFSGGPVFQEFRYFHSNNRCVFSGIIYNVITVGIKYYIFQGFTPAKHPDEKYFIFGQGGGEKIATEYNSQLIGQIPLVIEVGEAAEHGKSVFSQGNKTIIEAFEKIAVNLISATIF